MLEHGEPWKINGSDHKIDLKWRYPIHILHAFQISWIASMTREIWLFLPLSHGKQCVRRCESNNLEAISWVNTRQKGLHPSLIWLYKTFPTTYPKLWILTFQGKFDFLNYLNKNIRKININFKKS